MKVIKLKKGKEISVLRKHPWVFSGAIQNDKEYVQDGDIVKLISFEGKFLGIGHFQNSSLSIRIFSFEDIEINEEFWLKKIIDAFKYRVDLEIINESTNCFRLVFGESDGLPGLIIDYYNGNIVFQAHSIGMHLLKNTISNALQKITELKVNTIYDKSKDSLPGNYSKEIKNSFISGNNDYTIVTENYNKFHINWVIGQKTGFFLDQRENRNLLSKYVKEKNVLNAFCYTGGFSVYAANSGAKSVHSLDSSKTAIELTEKNILENKISNHKSFCQDAFDFLKASDMNYDVVILDPPAFAKHMDAKHKAVIGYKNLNATTIRKMKSGAILFTFSCTQVVNKNLFFNTVSAAAIEAKREIRILHYLHQPADHPINPLHPESEYLKGLVVKIIN